MAHLCVGSWEWLDGLLEKTDTAGYVQRHLWRSSFPLRFRCLFCSLKRTECLPWLGHRVSCLALKWNRSTGIKKSNGFKARLSWIKYIFLYLCHWSFRFPSPRKIVIVPDTGDRSCVIKTQQDRGVLAITGW